MKPNAGGLFLSACWFWLRNQFGELPEVLCCGCELELFVCRQSGQ